MNLTLKGTVGLLGATVCTAVHADNLTVSALATRVIEEYPAVHQYLDSLGADQVELICQVATGDMPYAETDQVEELDVLLRLTSMIQTNSQGLCVVKELQSMIGWEEDRQPSSGSTTK